jgi:formate--tetrahydrofolate ligase
MKTDIEIARDAKMKHINEIASMLGIEVDELQHYGKYKAKLPLHLINRERGKQAKLVLVSAISPTPAGECK